MKLLVLTRYGRLGASSRVRMLQYLPHLEAEGWQVSISPLFSDEYVRALYGRGSRAGPALAGYGRRLGALAGAWGYDLLWLEKELLPFLPAWAESLLASTGVRYVVDYDDAVFHRYDRHQLGLVRILLGRKIDAVMRRSAVVVAGNHYLAEHAQAAGARRIEIVPTVVDLNRYPLAPPREGGPLTIGWIGSPATTRYLSLCAPALRAVRRHYDVRIVAVGADPQALPSDDIETWPWAEETEVASLHAFDVGIMPLPDAPFERGKCGYKLIQYMACGIPVVASPVSINTSIVTHGVTGMLASTERQWQDALEALLADPQWRQRLSDAGRKHVQADYTLQVQAPRLTAILAGAARLAQQVGAH